jgi:AhpD family alkylhydroperoxidase
LSDVRTIQEIEWETPPLVQPRRDRDLERSVRQELGAFPPALRYLGAVPWLVQAEMTLTAARFVHLNVELAELAAVVVSRDNSCRLCYAASRFLLRVTGVPDDRIEKLEQGFSEAELDSRATLGLDFVRRISRSNPLASSADKKLLLDAGYGENEIKELAFAAVMNVSANRVMTLTAVPPDLPERLAKTRLLAIVRPYLRRILHRFHARRRGEAEYLPASLKTGPFSYLVLALDGLPIARSLREVIDLAWSSEILTRRAKALAFAVVARGIGCPHSEREAFRLLEAEGLSAARSAEILDHLGGPELDAVESAVIPYVRETIWYQHPARVQRKGRELRTHLSEEQFLELVGVTALANVVSRLGIVLEET